MTREQDKPYFWNRRILNSTVQGHPASKFNVSAWINLQVGRSRSDMQASKLNKSLTHWLVIDTAQLDDYWPGYCLNSACEVICTGLTHKTICLHIDISWSVCRVCMHVCTCFVCLCVWKDGENERERDKEREWCESMWCVCMCNILERMRWRGDSVRV